MIKLNIIKHRTLWLSISAVMVTCAVIALFAWGLKFGIDFTGGSLMELKFADSQPSVISVQTQLAELEITSVIVQPTEDSIILRFKESDEGSHQRVKEKLSLLPEAEGGMEELRFESVGPSIGQELRSKSFWLMFFVVLVIIIYIALVFQKVSRPVASWKYGLIAVVALFHDVLIILGIFAFLGRFYGIEVNTTFVVAILTILGYSVNDTIVVFDRTRENLPKSNEDFPTTVNNSLNQTLVRSLSTSFTTVLVLLAIFFLGGDSVSDFVLALIIGIIFGSYSSVFLASPLLVAWEKWQRRA